METYDLSSSSSVADFSYVEQMRYFQYLQEQMQQENELNAYISECLCLSEGASLKEFQMLHEAITDKASAAWNKALDFIRRMWAKFSETINNLVSMDNSYLKKYQDIILNRPIKFANRVKMNNCAEAVKRMVKTQVKVIDSAILDDIPTDTSNEDGMNKIRNRMVPEWNSGNPEGGNPDQNDFVGWLKNFFMANDKQIDADPKGSDFNIRDMFNFCYEYNNGQLKKSIDNDNTAIKRTSDEFEKEVKKAREDAKKKKDDEKNQDQKGQGDQQGDKSKPGEDAFKPGEQGKQGTTVVQQDNKAKDQHVEQHSTNMSLIYPNLTITEAMSLYEMEVTDKGTGSGTTKNDMSNTAAAAQRNATADKKVNADEANKVAGGEMTEEDISAKARIYITLSGNVATAKWTGCKYVYDEYMQFIRAHVRSYVGNDKDAAAAPAAQGTNYNQVAGNKPQQQGNQQQGQQAQQTSGQ